VSVAAYGNSDGDRWFGAVGLSEDGANRALAAAVWKDVVPGTWSPSSRSDRPIRPNSYFSSVASVFTRRRRRRRLTRRRQSRRRAASVMYGGNIMHVATVQACSTLIIVDGRRSNGGAEGGFHEIVYDEKNPTAKV